MGEEDKKKNMGEMFPDEMKPKLSEEQIRRLRNNFDRYVDKNTSLLPENLLEKVVDASRLELREGERKQMIELAKIVSEGVPWETLYTLANGWIDVNMLHILFNEANTNTKLERVEFFLDVEEIFNLFKSIGMDKTKEEIEASMDKLDKDADGQCDWEEFLTVATSLMGANVNVNKNDPDGTDFNQLRDSTKKMKASLLLTNDVVDEYEEEITKKKDEIEKRLSDTSLEDVRVKLKVEWDDKDELEMQLLDTKTDHFKLMDKLMQENDQEKAALVERFKETIEERNEVRLQIRGIRRYFGERFGRQFVEVGRVNEILVNISQATGSTMLGLDTATEAAESARQAWQETAIFEQPPNTSTSEKAIEFISNQDAVMSEISTKMKLMQQERDKYEDMIEEEMMRNKEKRIECVNLNMEITNKETDEMAVQAKCKDLEIQNITLTEELKKKLEDTDSKKVKELKNTVWQFKEERDAIVEQVDDIKSKMRHITKMYDLSKKKSSQLNIELGELKILLEGMQVLDDDEDDPFADLF